MSKEAMKLALETSEGIVNADWRKWDELASSAEFERWAKSRANFMATILREALNAPLAEQPAQQQELEHDEHGPECSPEEFLLRGILASELKCWHRLTADEAKNLVAFVQNMPAKPAQQEPNIPGLEADPSAFVRWARKSGYDMTSHPLHFLFLNEKTAAARAGWKAAHAFYTSPPAQRTWVGLTDWERDDVLDNYFTDEGRARAIEAKLKERNT